PDGTGGGLPDGTNGTQDALVIETTCTSAQVARAFSGRRALVTGRAVSLGRSLVRRLAEAGARVTVLDDLFTGLPQTVPTGAQLIEGSGVDEAVVPRLRAGAT